jgi:ATP-binding cassette, subfamily F, member 3
VISVSGLAKAHGSTPLFRDVSFRLLPGVRMAIVGSNGAGKSTLLEIILGTQDADAGEIHRTKNLKLGYLPQELVEMGNGSVIDEVLAGAAEIRDLEHRLHHLAEEMAAHPSGPAHDKAMHEYGLAQARFEALNGYAIEAEAHRVLDGLGFSTSDADRPVQDLSGGWRMRVALARLLIDQPDILILDEPTNHLDVDSVAWLEQTLSEWPGALLLVSHDRDFIDAVVERVFEIAGGTGTEYVGGFAEFVVQREERYQQAMAAQAQQQRQIAHVEKFIERFRYKATKARQVQSRMKTLERWTRSRFPPRRSCGPASGSPSRPARQPGGGRAGRRGHRLRGRRAVLHGVDLVIERGMKLGFVGPNGAGKTTLVRLILGQMPPLSGRMQLSPTIKAAVFTQHQVESLNLERSVVAELATVAGDRPNGKTVRTIAGNFGFSGDAAERKVGALSGGERTRLALAKCMIEPVNLLVLDEPTNHLDLASCDLLEDALQAYPGTVLLVSHDRHLIRNVSTGLVAVRHGRATYHDGVDEAVLSPSYARATGTAPRSPLPRRHQRARRPLRRRRRPTAPPAASRERSNARSAAPPPRN